jgi:hypothetical protein
VLRRSLLLLYLFALVGACSARADTAFAPTFTSQEFEIVELDAMELPYSRAHPVPIDDGEASDADGVSLYERSGQEFYHPVVLAQRGLMLLASYEITDDKAYLDLAKRHAERLIEEADDIGGALYFPYEFDFALHGREDAVLPAPWYSGMAEGQALSLFTRLHSELGDPQFLAAADKTFASFQRLKNDGADPWTVMVDDDGYLWLEEYPTPEADHHALNGHIFAIYGLYDYYQSTGEGLDELRGALTTVMNHFDEYRNPNGPSFYELKFGVADEKYHAIHIQQLETLSRMTSDERFSRMSETLACDSPPDPSLLTSLNC